MYTLHINDLFAYVIIIILGYGDENIIKNKNNSLEKDDLFSSKCWKCIGKEESLQNTNPSLQNEYCAITD